MPAGERLRPAASATGHSGYRPASFFRAAAAPQTAPPPPVVTVSPVKKKAGWRGWNALFRRRKASSDSSSDETAAAERRRETACVTSPPPRSPVSCYPRHRPAGSAESLETPRAVSSGSEATSAGRRTRRSAVKARVEARRSNTASSEEDEPPLQRVSSQLSLPRDGSLSRRSRAARTERYNRRRSRDDVSLQQEMALERRRDEERRAGAPQNWAATVVCRQMENGAHPGPAPGPRPPPQAGQHPRRPRLQPSQPAALQRRNGPALVNGAEPQPASPCQPSPLHHCDERYPLPAPAPAPRSPLAASMSAPLPSTRQDKRPPPPPPRDPRIKITIFPEPGPVSHSLDQLTGSGRSQTVMAADGPAPGGPLSSRSGSAPAPAPAPAARVRLGHHLSGSDQSIARYKQQLYGRRPAADQLYSYTDTAPGPVSGQLRSYTDQAPTRAGGRSRYLSQDSAFLSDSQTPAPTVNGATEPWRDREQCAAPTETRPPPPPPPPKAQLSPPDDSLASSLSEISAPRSQNTSFSCHDSDSVLGRSRGERRPLSLVAEPRTELAEPPPPRPASELAQRPSENFEEALDELEAIYKSLRLDDEDLLDRAERRDLPTPHQEMWRAPPAEPSQEADEPDLNCTLSSEELSGGRWQSVSSLGSESRHRAPALRRSAVPNKREDDVYTRRLRRNEKNPNSNLLSEVLSQGGSYLLVSPVLSPTASLDNVRSEPPIVGEPEPDLTLDDVTFRNNRHANAVRIIEPQPPFGIPLGPTCPAAASDYLHVTPPQGKTRATFRPRRNPDLVADDLAFRALRKDDKTVIDTNALDALIRETDQIGKRRATRTLSDDLSLMVKSEAKQPSGRPVSLCICGGHSVSDCELDEAATAAAAAAAALHTRPIRLRPRPESQRTYGLYNLYVGHLSEPESAGSRPSSRASRSRTASVATSTETLTEAGQRRTSGEFATKVRPFVRVGSEPEGDPAPPVGRDRAATEPPSAGRAASASQLDSLLEGLRLDETSAGSDRRHRPPRLTETLRALADIDGEGIPRAMAALDSLTARQTQREAISTILEPTDQSPAVCQTYEDQPRPSQPTPLTEPPSQLPSQPFSQPPNQPAPPSQPTLPSQSPKQPTLPSQPPSQPTLPSQPSSQPPNQPTPLLSQPALLIQLPSQSPSQSPSPICAAPPPPPAAARPPVAGEEAAVRPRPGAASPEAEAVRKGSACLPPRLG